jgi:HK97 family phage prohead protease
MSTKRHGVLTIPIPEGQPFPSLTPLDLAADKLQTDRRVLDRLKLLNNVRRLLPFVRDLGERQALQLAEGRLSSNPVNVSDDFVRSFTKTVEAKLSQIPLAQVRSASFQASTRAAGDRTITADITDEDITDRHGTRLKIAGLETANYMRNPVVGWMHNLYGSPWTAPEVEHIIGRTLKLQRSGSRLSATIQFLPESVNPTAERIYQMVKRGFLNSTSIGFIPRQVAVERIGEKDVTVITKSELLEVSIVALPSNVGAEITGRTASRASNEDVAAVRLGLRKGLAALKY